MDSSNVLGILREALQVEIGTIVFGWFLFVVGLVSKDVLTAIVFGFLFYLNPNFREGDIVYIDGEEAIIQKIGFTTTVFNLLEKSKWRYIKNEKIRYHRLEKKIPSRTEK